MMSNDFNRLKVLILASVPEDGVAIGNQSLLAALQQQNPAITDAAFQEAKEQLIAEGELAKGRGRGGSVSRVVETDDDSDPEGDDDEEGDEFELAVQDEPTGGRSRRIGKPGKTKQRGDGARQVLSYRHLDKRVNNPEVGMVHPENDPEQPKTTWTYDPHIDPALQFDSARARVEKLIDDALASGDTETMRDALMELKRLQEPYLNWAGKAERTSFEIDTVSLHVHERIDPASILAAIRKRMKGEKDGNGANFQPGLFDAPFENLPLRQAIDFYKHDKNWSNRLIAGDSLLVMNSLLQKESMAGRVQMIYIDPPYGIKYGSNFQPFTNKRDVKDGADADLTQEPEMIKAFRDTWELGIHSYLTYLRDRLVLARDLLHESGSVFVQISEENVHLVRNIMDEIFGNGNFVSQIIFKKTTSSSADSLSVVADHLIWFARDRSKLKYRALYQEKIAGEAGATDYGYAQTKDGFRRPSRPSDTTDVRLFTLSDITSQRPAQGGDVRAFEFEGKDVFPGAGTFKTDLTGLTRLSKSRRLYSRTNSMRYVRFFEDFPVFPYTNVWDDTIIGHNADKVYVVQTFGKVIERCLLMTTDPGDLVLDPTSGSGTTAFVAEKWGRRWITCDTSRVAITLAKQRLMTASFDYFALRYPHEGLKGGFDYETVPHITLKSIANNPDIDSIYAEAHPKITSALSALNADLIHTSPAPLRPGQGVRKGKPVSFRDGEALHEWEVPFDWPESWLAGAKGSFEAFHSVRQAMQQRMDASISDHAEQETLYDKPRRDPNRLRITGPFSVEAVPNPTVMSLDEGQPAGDANAAIARTGETSRQATWRDELIKTGIRGKGGQIMRFAELETIPGLRHLHLSGNLAETGERVVVSFGPEHAALEQRQVELALSEAEKLRPSPKLIVFCSFAFDPEAAKDIDEVRWPGVTLLKAQMNTDLLTEDLKKARSSNQSFWLMGQPDVELRALPDGMWQVEVHGFDYFDTKQGELVSGGKSKIAMWSLDTDYDQRSLFPHQVFFPMAGAKDGWHRLKKGIKAELNEELIDEFHGTVSLPFQAGDNRRAAVKIVDDRGIESLKIIELAR